MPVGGRARRLRRVAGHCRAMRRERLTGDGSPDPLRIPNTFPVRSAFPTHSLSAPHSQHIPCPQVVGRGVPAAPPGNDASRVRAVRG